MKIYVGRWDMLPYEWEGINGLSRQDKDGIIKELAREVELYATTHAREDNRMGVYTAQEFEDEFNYDTKGAFNTETYWIKIF